MNPAPDLSCLACGESHPKARLVRLIDGREVSNHSEAWRHETEARSIARQSFGDRHQHLERIRKMRGAAAADALEKTIQIIGRKS